MNKQYRVVSFAVFTFDKALNTEQVVKVLSTGNSDKYDYIHKYTISSDKSVFIFKYPHSSTMLTKLKELISFSKEQKNRHGISFTIHMKSDLVEE